MRIVLSEMDHFLGSGPMVFLQKVQKFICTILYMQQIRQWVMEGLLFMACQKCKEEFDLSITRCPFCGGELVRVRRIDDSEFIKK